MGGQEYFKHARAMGIRGCWMKIRRGVRREKRTGLGFLVDICSRSCKINGMQR